MLQAIEQRRASLQDNPLGIQPEKALVLETIGSIERFVVAVRNTEGLEWLGEIELEDIEPDHGFEDISDPSKQLKGQLFLVMSDQVALRQIHSLFKKWEKDQGAKFPDGHAEWKKVFSYLKDIRPWGPEDRIRETGLLEDWRLRLASDQSAVPFEAELWFRNNPSRRWQAQEEVRKAVEDFDGEVLQQCVIADIAYHAVLGRIPRDQAQEIANQSAKYQDIKLLQCDGIMHIRPTGQFAILAAEDGIETRDQDPDSAHLPNGKPIIGLLDGLPLTGHQGLAGRLIVDDPDDFGSAYQARERVHGTAMASLICHGDMNEDNESIRKPVYVRPLMRPQHDLNGEFVGEMIPEDILAVDLVHRAVRRLYESQEGEPPAAPSVRIINFSICDLDRPLGQSMSSLARLIDWLAWSFNVLFIVSAGNHLDEISLGIPMSEFWNLDERGRTELVLKAIADDTRNRRLLSPAETLNGLTVGAVHEDSSSAEWLPYSIDPFPALPPETLLPSPPIRLPAVYSAHGPGYRRAIKPDLLVPGGRQSVSEKLGNSGTGVLLRPDATVRPPGQCVATPSVSGGSLSHTRHTRGTSNAAALATRSASTIFDVLEHLRGESEGNPPPEFDTVLAKALLIHSAEWSDAYHIYEATLKDPTNGHQFKDYAGRFLGYGPIDASKAIVCTDQSATILGFGNLGDGDAHEFRLPLPSSLSAVSELRRLTITLAWLTPVSSTNRRYRTAQLWFDPNQQNVIARKRREADHDAVQRGTVQHEILESSEAVPFQDGDSVRIKVNCRADSEDFLDSIRYGLAVTLEVSQNSRIQIYQEIRNRLGVGIPVQVSGSG